MCEFLRQTHKSQPCNMLVFFMASSQVPRPSPFRQTWTLREVTERDGDWHIPYIRLFSDNEAREDGWGLGWGGIIHIIIHSKYFPNSDWLKAHAQFNITSY